MTANNSDPREPLSPVATVYDAMGDRHMEPAADLREARTAFEKWAMETWLGGINLAWTESRNCYDDFATHIGFKGYVEGARAALASSPTEPNFREELEGALLVLEIIAANRKGELMSNVETRAHTFVNVIDPIMRIRKALAQSRPTPASAGASDRG